jgi:outer membrane protein assembly factor BamE (lipoprotein component of BamABCDE complex)
MIIDPLHKNRWDYVYSWQSGKHDEEFKLKRLTLFFKQGKLSHLVSDYKPQQPTELQQQADSPTDTKPSK